MKAEHRAINQVLTEQLRYEIPPYQRPYSWQVEQTTDLLTDIEEAFNEQDKEYFIGSLITIEHEANNRYEVVDGQQRLTTLSLIFARLRASIENEAAKQELGKRLIPSNPLTGATGTPRLTLRKRDQPFFEKYVLEGSPHTGVDRANLDAPQENILANMECIDAFIAGKPQEWLKSFAGFILSSVFVVAVTTENFQSAYRLFNVLNARGMRLSNADLIKNQLFSKLGGSAAGSEKLETLWVSLEETVGLENLDAFLGTHRLTIAAEKARKSMAQEYELLISQAGLEPINFVETLLASAANYSRIMDRNFAQLAARQSVRALERVPHDEWIPPLLAFLNRPVPDLGEQEFLLLLEKITMQNWIRRLGNAKRNTIYYRLISALNRGASDAAIRSVFKEAANNTDVMSLLSGSVYEFPSARAVLLRLEEAMQDTSVVKEFNGPITIEHVLPQTLKDQYWLARFPANDHKRLVHCLGNITLLSGKKNSQAQNYSFDKKLKVYKEKNSKVSFDLTKEICDRTEWTIQEVEARQRRLMRVAESLWSIS